jgi:hypothetical protein
VPAQRISSENGCRPVTATLLAKYRRTENIDLTLQGESNRFTLKQHGKEYAGMALSLIRYLFDCVSGSYITYDINSGEESVPDDKTTTLK